MALSPQELARYGRHLALSEIGLSGQEKIKGASVVIVGVGGLGSPIALYLAAAGVGTIGIMDHDTVSISNLHRQIIHGTADVDRHKVDSAREILADLNPHVMVRPHNIQITSENALDLLKPYDIVVDATDNFVARYLINDATVLLDKPNIYGSIYRFDGQVAVLHANGGPCYRCLYPEPPDPDTVPNCSIGGVLGVLPGVIGSLMANEALKLILGIGESLAGHLLLFDALDVSFKQVEVSRQVHCPVCGDEPTITKLIDYDDFCGIQPSLQGQVPEITVTELADTLENVMLVDVRESWERIVAKIDGSISMPLGQFPERLHELPRNKQIVVHCRSGARSARATKQLLDSGYTDVHNLAGGILAWAEEVDPNMVGY